jgi:2-C-methyl-D-erythritol 4-phosphate cytidylyltransferase
MFVSAIIVAAGKGERMRTPVPKQFLDIDGIPLISFSLSYFENAEVVDEVIIVAPSKWIDYVEKQIVLKGRFRKIGRVVEGGRLRQDSFKNGLVIARGEIVIDHDAARPFPGVLNIDAMIEKCKKVGAIIPIIPVNDTVKYVVEERIKKSIDRRNLFCVQTPQVFKKKLCERAYKRAEEDGFYGSDTASLLENAGIPVFTTLGSAFNKKITTEDDLALVKAINQYYFNH